MIPPILVALIALYAVSVVGESGGIAPDGSSLCTVVAIEEIAIAATRLLSLAVLADRMALGHQNLGLTQFWF